jgi:hypothetical protein
MHRLREWMTRHPWLCGATALVGFFWSAHEFLNWRTERKGRAVPGAGNAIKGTRIDWSAWSQFLMENGLLSATSDEPVRDVLRALDTRAEELSQWREWPRRPRCRFPLDLAAGAAMSCPHLSALLNAAPFFALRVRAPLALGDPVAAAYSEFCDRLLPGARRRADLDLGPRSPRDAQWPAAHHRRRLA